MLELPDQILILRKDLGKFYIASDYLYGTTGGIGIEILDGDIRVGVINRLLWYIYLLT